MDSVNKTLYIPLYGKASVSRKGIILQDKKAEEIWAEEGFPLKGKAKSKWLTYYMGMRSAVFDRWLTGKMEAYPEATVLHIGCGMDSRVTRVGEGSHLWFDVDFPDVIDQRRRYFSETENYRMVAADIREDGWLDQIPGKTAIAVMEGVSMYLAPEDLKAFLEKLSGNFERLYLLTDCYTVFAAKATKYKNPINEVGVTQVYGMEDPRALEASGLTFVREHEMTPSNLIEQLQPLEQRIFRKVFAGRFAGKLYRLYEYGK